MNFLKKLNLILKFFFGYNVDELTSNYIYFLKKTLNYFKINHDFKFHKKITLTLIFFYLKVIGLFNY